LPSFRELGLPRGLAEVLSRRGLTRPFPIQAAVIADVLAGRDVLGRAATGAGKTLAFGLPTIARLEGGQATPRKPRALVLVPTRELAMQVCDALAPIAQGRGLSVRLVAGGLAMSKQIDGLVRGVDLLVATPGRLMDLMERGACRLDAVETTILDEADHMADLGFLPAVRTILNATPSNAQRLLFSATLDGDVQTLIEEYLTDPAAHAVASATAQIETMSHHVLTVEHAAKVEIAARIGARDGRTIMFVRTKHGADRLATQLSRLGVAAGALHGGRSQSQRTRALNAFRDGTVPVLVATDVAARGIHVDDVSLVLHVDPPAESKDYLHRSGRTARAGASGTVVMLSTPDQTRTVRRLLKDAAVTATEARTGADDPTQLAELAELTGAREPSRVPVADRPQRSADRPQRSHRSSEGSKRSSDRPHRSSRPERSERRPRVESADQPAADRSSWSEGPRRPGRPKRPSTTRHPQHAERRPRRENRARPTSH
jgi:superfamily II DNA/RNA helicase